MGEAGRQRVGCAYSASVAHWIVGLLLAVAMTSGSAAARGSAPVPFQMIFEGRSEGTGRGVEGAFTATAPRCASGRFSDATGTPLAGIRIRVDRSLTCADGTGTVTVVYEGVREFLDGPGTWRIRSGSGRYAALRGTGSTRNVNISHDPQTGAGAFRNVADGLAALDAEPPQVTLTAASARRVRKRPPLQTLRVVFAAADRAGSEPLDYELAVLDESATRTHVRKGKTSALTSVTLRTNTRSSRVRIELTVRDAVANERVVRRSLRIR